MNDFEKAVQCINNGDFQKAEQVLQHIRAKDERNFDAIHMLGIVCSELGKFHEAEQFFTIALSIDAKYPPLYRNYGLFLNKTERFREAIEKFNIAIDLAPTYPPVYGDRGNSLRELGQLDEAINDHNRAISLAPGFFGFYNNRGNALQKKGRYLEALSDFDAAIKLNPNYAEAHCGRGNVYWDLKQYDEAFAAYQKALFIKPDLLEAWRGQGNVYLEFKQYDQALAAYDHALSLKPDLAEAWLGRANVYLELKQDDQALAAYDRALSLKPDLAEAWLGRGNALDTCREHEEAVAHYEKALAVRPGYADAHADLWVALWSLGRHEEALAHYEKLLALNPNYVETLSRDNALTAFHVISDFPELKTHIDLLAQLDRLVGRGGPGQAEFENLAAFVRARVLDKAGRYAEAWEQLVPANRMLFLAGKQGFDEMIARERANLLRLKESAATLAANGATDDGKPISLLILGPSRSGKTTAERLLSWVQGVKRGYENPIVEKTVRRACQIAGLPLTPWFQDLPATLRPTCREIYVEELAKRAGSAQVFTITHPIRIHDADLMVGAFPNVRLLLVKRNVEDLVLRIYMRKYSVGNLYSYDLIAARDHVMWYHEMMDLLAARFPEIARIIHYDEMIADPAATLRAAAGLCGLSMPQQAALPPLEDDRKCAEPYRHFMLAHLDS